MAATLLSIVKFIAVGAVALVALIVLGFVVVPPATRWFTDGWGATPAERAEVMPGDDLFPATREISTKAVTVDASPETVYALVQQMGQHRAGWYGWDWFYNATNSSDFVDGHYSRRIVPELQDVEVGDTIGINDMVAYTVVRADAPGAFVLTAGSLDPSALPVASMPETWTQNSMAFVIRPAGEGKTRLLLRMRADGTETGFERWMWNGPLNFGGALFSHKTLVGIKRTAEGL